MTKDETTKAAGMEPEAAIEFSGRATDDADEQDAEGHGRVAGKATDDTGMEPESGMEPDDVLKGGRF